MPRSVSAPPLPSLRDLVRRPGALGLGLGQMGQALGFFLTLMALAIGVARIGHDHVLGLSALFVVMALPAIFVDPFLAPLVELWNKRTTMAVGQLGKAASLAVVALVPGIWALVLGGLLVMLFHGIYLPAYRSLLAEVAEGDEQVRLTSLVHTGTTAMQMVGMGLGGALAVLSTPSAALWAGAVAFGMSAVMVSLVPTSLIGVAGRGEGVNATARRPPQPSYGVRLREGIRAVGASPLAIRIVLVLSLMSAAFYVLNPVLVLIPARILHVPLWWYPIFEISQGLFGMLLGGLVSSRLPLPPRRLMGLGFVATGLAFAGLAVSRSAVLDVALYGVIGLAQMAEIPVAMALYRNQFALSIRSRATAALTTSLAMTQAMGAALAGILAHALGISGTLAVGGAMVLVAAAIGARVHLFREDQPVASSGAAAG